MTETAWLTTHDSEAMLQFIRGKASKRKMRLFAVAVARQFGLTGSNLAAVELAESIADEPMEMMQLYRAKSSLGTQFLGTGFSAQDYRDRGLSNLCSFIAARNTLSGTLSSEVNLDSADWRFIRQTSGNTYALLVRELFGNPYQPVTIDPSCLTPIVTALTRRMYEVRDFSTMPILGDALEEVGCQDASVLGHCRGDDPHSRGCFVVDAILGKA